MTFTFVDAVKEQLRGRVALCGPTGSGKSWTALGWATELAGPQLSPEELKTKIAMIDTERRSGSLYANHFSFRKLDWPPPYDPNKLIDAIKAAEAQGFEVLIIDSLTHFWTGEGGTLEVVDNAAARNHGNKFIAWGVGTPLQRKMVDTILAANMHIIITMRSKMEYVLDEVEVNGRKITRPTKVGMAPEQRGGIEYEFTIVGDLDLEHRISINKSRCDVLADAVIQPHQEREAAKIFLNWLNDGEAMASVDDKRKIGSALRIVPEGPERDEVQKLVVEQFGPSAQLKAAQVDEVLAFIESKTAKPEEPPATTGKSTPPYATKNQVETPDPTSIEKNVESEVAGEAPEAAAESDEPPTTSGDGELAKASAGYSEEPF